MWQGGHGPTGHIGRLMPCGIARWPTRPAMSLIHVICKVAPLGVITTLDPCRFDPRMDVELPWITGSTVIHLEDQNHPPYRLTSWETDLPAMQLMVSQHPLTSLDGQVSPNLLIFDYKYPHALYTL